MGINNSKEKDKKLETEDIIEMLTSLSKVYYCVYYLNMKNGSFVELNARDNVVHSMIGETGNSQEKLGFMTSKLVSDEFIGEVREFTDLSTLNERLKNKHYITIEFIRRKTGWVQGYFIAGDRDDEGNLNHAFWAVREINDEKKREAALSQKIENGIRDQLEQTVQLKKQYEIVEALSSDYLNVFNVNLETNTATIIKLDGYVTKGINRNQEVYAYDRLYKQYVKDRVYINDQELMLSAMSAKEVIKALETDNEYVASYRVIEDGELHNYQFKYIKAEKSFGYSNVIAGFQNIDKLVQAAIEREKLIIKSETDIMTGVLNRGSGEMKSTKAIAKEQGGMLCIMDLDKFKTINDTYGHLVGDNVIIAFAKCLKNTFRDNDIVFRLGGDEFAVFMVGDIAMSDAVKVLERLKKNIYNIDIPELGTRKVEVSIGASIVKPDEGVSFEEVYKRADTCVYKSKKEEGTYITFFEA
jgi:diguanylate cyclase (GGDEF)-like protein